MSILKAWGDEDLAKVLEAPHAVRVESHDELDHGLPLHDLRNLVHARRDFEGTRDISDAHAITGESGAIEARAHEWNVRLLFAREIHDTWNLAHCSLDCAAELPEHLKVVAEDLDRDARARAGEHMIDPMRDRLADRNVHARDQRELAAQRF